MALPQGLNIGHEDKIYSQMTPVTTIDQETDKHPWRPGPLKHCLESQHGRSPNEDNVLVEIKKSHTNVMKLDHDWEVKTTGKSR